MAQFQERQLSLGVQAQCYCELACSCFIGRCMFLSIVCFTLGTLQRDEAVVEVEQ